MLVRNIASWTNRYIRVGNIHILLDVDATITKIIEEKENINNMNFHLFISTMESADNIIPFIEHLRGSRKLTIHIPKQLKDLGPYVKDMIQDYPYCKVVVEKKGPEFRVPGEVRTWVIARYTDTGISLELRLIHSLYKGYNVNTFSPITRQGPTVISNTPRLMKPFLFKDELIKAFKEATPDGILKSFETDEDIWKYIMMEGEWSVSDDKPKVSYSDKMVDDIMPLFNSQLEKKMGDPKDEDSTEN